MEKWIIPAEKITIETKDESIVYDKTKVKKVFKKSPDKRGRIHLGTTNKVIVIELIGEVLWDY
jgi:hypothetical protein